MNFKKLVKKILGKDLTYQEKLARKGFVYGKNLSVQGGVIIDDSHCWLISMGDNVTLAPRVHILAHDASTKNTLGYTKIGKVKIGNNVFIGASSLILPGVKIGDNVIIGAGSVVTKDIPSGMVVAGNPARVIKTVSEYLETQRAQMKKSPVFDDTYKDGKITNEKKQQMSAMLDEMDGYII